MDDLAIIDRFTETFSRYIDSGFGLLAGDVAFLTGILVAIDITLAGLFWAMAAEDNVPAQLIKKVLYVGFFALLLNNFKSLSEVVFNSFAGLGLKATGVSLTTADLMRPGFVASTGFTASRPLIEKAGELVGFTSFFTNFVTIVVLMLAWLIVLLAFFVLAVQLFITIIEFKLTTLAGFVLVPFALFGQTAFLAERVLGNVITAGIKLMVLTIVVGIGSSLFGTLIRPAGDITLTQAASTILAAIAVFGLAIFVPAIAAGLVSGAPQLGAGAAVGDHRWARRHGDRRRHAGVGRRAPRRPRNRRRHQVRRLAHRHGRRGLREPAACAALPARPSAAPASRAIAAATRPGPRCLPRRRRLRLSRTNRPPPTDRRSGRRCSRRCAQRLRHHPSAVRRPAWAQSLARRQRLTQAGMIAAQALREGDRPASAARPRTQRQELRSTPMTFKRSTLRYGETPQPVTPYQKAAQVWDERIGSARVQAQNWRLMALGSLGLSIVLAGILLWLGRTSAVIPYIVEVDPRGGARAVGPAAEVYKPSDAQIAFHLARFVEGVRGLSIDAGRGAAELAQGLRLRHRPRGDHAQRVRARQRPVRQGRTRDGHRRDHQRGARVRQLVPDPLAGKELRGRRA